MKKLWCYQSLVFTISLLSNMSVGYTSYKINFKTYFQKCVIFDLCYCVSVLFSLKRRVCVTIQCKFSANKFLCRFVYWERLPGDRWFQFWSLNKPAIKKNKRFSGSKLQIFSLNLAKSWINWIEQVTACHFLLVWKRLYILAIFVTTSCLAMVDVEYLPELELVLWSLLERKLIAFKWQIWKLKKYLPQLESSQKSQLNQR